MAKVRKVPGKNGFKYKPKFGVVIPCDDESAQRKAFEQVKKLGLPAKVVTV